ncbi:hypothetical protein OVY01_00110 [Robbsia sp. Bb-Pol-6]|uniref:Uncharacterized protein n=1 Tax=Robbsia betulipollinis TaxID=2981849 RepID=A0ABT3ZI65_9BURK|nr:hypothetical protein [Robbsia betulipollinis]MCY0385668.1 hypothetical protein [Robbsia betulipollinis]
MADFGLAVYNSSGYLQIDSTYKNLSLRTKGAVTSGGSPTATNWYSASFTVAYGTSPVMAFRPSSGQAMLLYSTVSGSNITYYVLCSASGVTVSYWVFDDPVSVTVSGLYGLIVNNAAGAKVFDSRSNYMRVVGVLSSPGVLTGDPMDSSGGITQTFGTSNLAVVQGQLRSSINNNSAGTGSTTYSLFLAAAFTVSGTSVVWKSANEQTTSTASGGVPPSQQSVLAYDYLVLDVSNM